MFSRAVVRVGKVRAKVQEKLAVAVLINLDVLGDPQQAARLILIRQKLRQVAAQLHALGSRLRFEPLQDEREDAGEGRRFHLAAFSSSRRIARERGPLRRPWSAE